MTLHEPTITPVARKPILTYIIGNTGYYIVADSTEYRRVWGTSGYLVYGG
jgi:hypothetical protein